MLAWLQQRYYFVKATLEDWGRWLSLQYVLLVTWIRLKTGL